MAQLTTGIEILSNKIRIVQLKVNAKLIKVVHWGEILFESQKLSDEEKGGVLKEYLNKHKLKCKYVVVGLPRNEITIRMIKLPTIDKNEIKSMLSYEVEQLVPFNSEDLILDYQMLSTDEKGYSTINVFILQKVIIQKYMKLCQECGFEPSKFQIRIGALVNLLNYMIETNKLDLSEHNIYSIFSIEDDTIEIGTIENKCLIFSRGVRLSSNNIDVLMTEIKKTEESYNREFNRSLFQDKCFIEDYSVSPDVKESFKSTISNYSEINLGDIFNVASNKGDNPEITNFDARYAVAGGLALQNYPTSIIDIDLLPEEIKDAKDVKAIRKSAVEFSILLIGIIILIYFNINTIFMIKENKIKYLQKQITSLKPIGSEIKKMRAKILVIYDQIDMRNSPLEILTEIVKVTPPDISLNSFHLDISNRLTLGGEAMDFSKPYKYIATLEQSKYFKNVSSQYVTRKRIGEQVTVIFKITCNVVKFGEESSK